MIDEDSSFLKQKDELGFLSKLAYVFMCFCDFSALSLHDCVSVGLQLFEHLVHMLLIVGFNSQLNYASIDACTVILVEVVYIEDVCTCPGYDIEEAGKCTRLVRQHRAEAYCTSRIDETSCDDSL